MIHIMGGKGEGGQGGGRSGIRAGCGLLKVFRFVGDTPNAILLAYV